MAGNTKALRVRIKSVTSTKQLTSAMSLVAGSKIRRAGEGMQKAREYAGALNQTLSLLTSDPEVQRSPYMCDRGNGRTRLVVIAGDRGLAGGYNANIFRLCREYENAWILPIGKRAAERFGGPILSSEHFTFDQALGMAKDLCRDFCSGEYDRLGVLYTKYLSVMNSVPTIQWILPLQKSEKSESDPIFEPDRMTVLPAAVMEYVAGMICAGVRESFACEVAARRNAMDAAKKNAAQMLDTLSLEYNRARQGAITQEITEIVAGSGEHAR